MIRISTRTWAGVLALLLPLLATASDKNDSSNNTSTITASAAKDSSTASSSPASTSPSPAAPTTGLSTASDPLLRLMVSQGLMNAEDVKNLAGVPSSELRDRLLVLLLSKNKNALSSEDLNALKGPAAGVAAEEASGPNASATQHTGAPQTPPTPSPSGPIPAVAPIRVLQINPPKREGVIPTLNVGNNIHIQPYGFFKTTAVYDTASPYSNDFPLPGFNPITNGPDKLAEFHLKARSLRVGSNFEWMDSSARLVATGKLEVDFEGNFTRVNNRSISSIRSSVPSIRLGYARLDYAATENTTLNFLAGQDWTIFGSSTLPNLLETTGYGIGFGTLYERNPQFRFGINHNFGGFSLEPDLAVVLPAFGNLPADLTVQSGPLAGAPIPGNEGVANQLGFGERQGADSARPEIQARLVGQFQLDHAAGVAPAQIIVSGVEAERDVVVLANAVPAAFTAAFPSGARISSNRHAWSGEIQLPTRLLTLVAKYYNGSDLRYYFAGQIFGPFNDTTGLTGTATAQSIDGSSTVVFGNLAGVPTVARSLPPRAQGGFVNIGLPLSRWANADPQGRNAGWQMYLHYGYDQVLARDVRRLGGGRMKGSLAAGTLYYKLNPWITFAVEESLYTTRAIPLTATGQFPSFAGRPMREINDFRTEIGPVFTF